MYRYSSFPLLFVLFFLPLYAAAQAPSNPAAEKVLLLNPKDILPSGAVPVGKKIKIIDKGFKIKCTYNDIVAESKAKTINAGGNVLKISEWRLPGPMSTCWGLKGQAYMVQDIESLRARIDAESNSVMKQLIPDTANYAMLYIYRPNGLGPLVSYNIHLNDSVICRVHNERYYAIPIHKQGQAVLWTRTEARVDLPVDIRFGKAYFLKCGVVMGAFVGHPTMRLVEPRIAIQQFKFDEVRHIEESEAD